MSEDDKQLLKQISLQASMEINKVSATLGTWTTTENVLKEAQKIYNWLVKED